MEGWTETDARAVIATRKTRKGYTSSVREFYETGLECIKKDFGDDVKRAYVAMYQAARRNNLPVDVMMRGTVIYLVRRQT